MEKMLIHVLFAIVACSTIWPIAGANPGIRSTTTERTTTARTRGKNLEGKMFTLSQSSGGIVFFPPYLTAQPPTSSDYNYPTDTPSTTIAPAVTGVSVCFRYLTDTQSIQQFFKLGSDSSHSLYLGLQSPPDSYSVMFNNQYNSMSFQPNKMFWVPNYDLWTSVCVTVDNRKKVAQVFSGSKMSIRKMLSAQMVWSGEPVIEFSSFDGQLTDVQVWDYPISFTDVLRFMYKKYHRTVRGSVITWSSINYSVRGNALLEDSYEVAREKILQKKFFLAEKHEVGKRQQL